MRCGSPTKGGGDIAGQERGGVVPCAALRPLRGRFAGGASRPALIPSVLDTALKGEL